jgi:hypothetical protein
VGGLGERVCVRDKKERERGERGGGERERRERERREREREERKRGERKREREREERERERDLMTVAGVPYAHDCVLALPGQKDDRYAGA